MSTVLERVEYEVQAALFARDVDRRMVAVRLAIADAEALLRLAQVVEASLTIETPQAVLDALRAVTEETP